MYVFYCTNFQFINLLLLYYYYYHYFIYAINFDIYVHIMYAYYIGRI